MLKPLFGLIFILSLALFASIRSPQVHAALTVGATSLSTDSNLTFSGVASSQYTLGTSSVTAGIALDIQPAVTASGGAAYGSRFQQTITAAANNDVLNGVYINPSFADAGKTGVTHYKLNVTDVAASNFTNIFSGPPSSSYTSFIANSLSRAANVLGTVNNGTMQTALMVVNESNNTTNSLRGQEINAISTHTSGTKGIFASDAEAYNENAGDVGNMFAYYGFVEQDGAGTVSNMAAFYADGNYRAAGTVTNNYGLFVANQSGVANTAANNYQIYSNTTNPFVVRSDGNVGIGTNAPTEVLDINSDTIRIRTAKTPASAGATCDQGEVAWDASFTYVCVATNTWKRSALSTW